MDHPVPRANHVFYTVYPSHPDDLTELSETKSFLQSLLDEDILDNRTIEELVSWRVALKEGVSPDELKHRKGIRLFEPEDAPLSYRSTEARVYAESKAWIVWAKDLNDVEQVNKAREWLDSKVKDKSRIRERKEISRRGLKREDRKVRGWRDVFLDGEGVKEAKERPDIADIAENSELISDSRVQQQTLKHLSRLTLAPPL
ncbi:hypothetical protein BU26DRAFT_157532 [Trematosphaeria pertusa]|uniref:Uncharacterized protein n=1 Tax=Trematosphaeria pertusa TaxID=390896 RepID=A0A6A6HWZ7_9PLEO|nr:uncharacterized protein BU26DRAFT_157532 [Trematosphaeria pertusa]KAF2242252.1 hypothetical protein BU26DRAFT_157532 [Trematosphaeria pertusa]